MLFPDLSAASQDLSFTALHYKETIVDEFLLDVREDNPDWRVGAGLRLPRFAQASTAKMVSEWSVSADYVLVDPETHRATLMPDEGRGRSAGYMRGDHPERDAKAFVRATIEAQVAVGADVVISPSLIDGTSATFQEIDRTVEFAELARALPAVDGRTLLIGIEATDDVFSQGSRLDHFLDRATDLGPSSFFLRMAVDPTITGLPQYRNAAALRGLRDAVESLVANGSRVVLAQSGLAGWLMLGFGATAFGAGARGSLQRSGRPVHKTGGGGNKSPLPWYFMPALLGHVLAEEVAPLRDALGAPACACPYCDGKDPQLVPDFDRAAADKHFLWWCARLTEDVRAADDRAVAVRRQVGAAVRAWNSAREAGVGLARDSRPRHLAAWSQVVA